MLPDFFILFVVSSLSLSSSDLPNTTAQIFLLLLGSSTLFVALGLSLLSSDLSDATAQVSPPPLHSFTLFIAPGLLLLFSDFPNAVIEVFPLLPSFSILLVVLNLLFRHIFLTDTSIKTLVLPQSILTISKSLLKDNALLDDITRNTFDLQSEEKKSRLVEKILPLIRKSSQIK